MQRTRNDIFMNLLLVIIDFASRVQNYNPTLNRVKERLTLTDRL